jgi:hypothetical protein
MAYFVFEFFLIDTRMMHGKQEGNPYMSHYFQQLDGQLAY